MTIRLSLAITGRLRSYMLLLQCRRSMAFIDHSPVGYGSERLFEEGRELAAMLADYGMAI